MYVNGDFYHNFLTIFTVNLKEISDNEQKNAPFSKMELKLLELESSEPK